MQKLLQKTPLANKPGWPGKLKNFTRKTVLRTVLLASSFLFAGQAQAQQAKSYNFEAISGTFTPLPATATQVPLLVVDTYLTPNILFPNGFVFRFEGIPYTSFKASSDGYLSFGSNTANTNSNSLSTVTSTRLPLLAPLWDNLAGEATIGSNAAYEVSGAAGSQVFTFEWLNWKFSRTATTPVISFQVKLYEADGKIEYHYRSESGAVTLGSATIGIAGLSGTSNFISLANTSANPGFGSVSSQDNLATKPATGQIYAFSAPVGNDVGSMGLAQPGIYSCFGPNQTVAFTVKNLGTNTIDFSLNPLTVTGNVTGPSPTTFAPVTVNSGLLVPGASQDVVVSTTYDMSVYGSYVFSANAAVANDGFPANGTNPPATRAHVPPVALPGLVDFTNFSGLNLTTIAPGWEEASGAPNASGRPYMMGGSNWRNADFARIANGPNGTAAIMNTDGSYVDAWIMSPKFVPAATTHLQFDLALTKYMSTQATKMGSDDLFQVMISTDCGASFSALQTWNAASSISNTGQKVTINLSNYAGQHVMLGFYGSSGALANSDNDLYLDNIFIGDLSTAEMGITELVTPVSPQCYSSSEPVSVGLKNFAATPLDLAANSATVTATVTHNGAIMHTFSTTVNTGTLNAGATMPITLGNIDMTATGDYVFNSTVSVAGDNFPFNDAMPPVTRTTTSLAVLPAFVDFTGFNGANLSTLFPGWSVGKGQVKPQGNASNWAGTAGWAGNNIAAGILIYQSTRGEHEWIVGPKFAATIETHLKFKAAITGTSNRGPATQGMDADDKVQVMISTDCGISFTPVYTIDASANLTNTFTDFKISLAAFAGQEIIVAIYATSGGTGTAANYYFHADDLNLVNIPPVDLSVTALPNPAGNGCFGTAEPVRVVLLNAGTVPVNFSATPATVSVAITGAATQTLTLQIADNSLNNGNPLASGDQIQVPVGLLNMETLGTYVFNASVAIPDDVNTGNNLLSAVSVTAAVPIAGTATAAAENLCLSSVTNLTLSGYSEGNIQWQQSSVVSGPFTDVTGATAASFTTPALAQTTFFRAIVGCNTLADTSNTVEVKFLQPGILAVTGDTVCRGSVATLTATPAPGTQIYWYDSQTQGNVIATGNTYSPVVWANTTFYAEAQALSAPATLQAHPLTPASFGCADGTMFDVNPVDNISISGFDQHLSAAAGTPVVVNVYYRTTTYAGAEADLSLWNLHETVTVTSAGPNNLTFVPVAPLNFIAGSPYAIYIDAPLHFTSVTSHMIYANANLSVTTGVGQCSFLTGFPLVAWQGAIRYTVNCSNATRVPVVAAVFNGPVQPNVTFAPGNRGVICQGDSNTLTAYSPTPGVTYQWLNNGTIIPGETSPVLVAKVTGGFVAMVTDTNGCTANSNLYTVTVNPKPATPTITQGGAGNRDLTSSSAMGNQWFMNGTAIAGATAETYTATANGAYTVVVTNANGCFSDTSAVVNITNTGVRGDLAGMSVSVYPNPNKGQFNVKLIGYNHDAALELYSLTGQLIVKENVKAGQEVTAMQVKNLAAGTYLLKVVSEKGVQISKLIVE